MPNWCSNRATITGPAPVIQEIVDILNQDDSPLLNWMVPEPKHKGDQDWYDWRVNNWGTKWDICDVYFENQAEEDSIEFSFCSAWAPPIDAFHTWAANDGRVQFTVEYWEPGMGFVGRSEWDGEFLSEDHRDANQDRAGYLELANEAFGYVEDVEEEPLTEWYTQGVKDKGLV